MTLTCSSHTLPLNPDDLPQTITICSDDAPCTVSFNIDPLSPGIPDAELTEEANCVDVEIPEGTVGCTAVSSGQPDLLIV